MATYALLSSGLGRSAAPLTRPARTSSGRGRGRARMSASSSPPPVSTPHACVCSTKDSTVSPGYHSSSSQQQHRPVLSCRPRAGQGTPPPHRLARTRLSVLSSGQQSDGSSDCSSERLHHRSVCHMSPASNATFSFNFIRSTVQRSTARPDWSDLPPPGPGSTRWWWWSQVMAPPILETDRRQRLVVSPALQTLLLLGSGWFLGRFLGGYGQMGEGVRGVW